MRKYRWLVLVASSLFTIWLAYFLLSGGRPVALRGVVSAKMFNISAICAVVFFILSALLSYASGRLKFSQAIVRFLYFFVNSIVAGAAGFGLFKMMQAADVNMSLDVFSTVWWFDSALLLAVILLVIVFYLINRRRVVRTISTYSVRRSAVSSSAAKFAYQNLYSTMLGIALFAILILTVDVDSLLGCNTVVLSGNDPVYFFVPFFASCIALIIWRLLRWRGVSILPIVTTLLSLILAFCRSVPTVDMLGLTGTLILICLELPLLISWVDIYTRDQRLI